MPDPTLLRFFLVVDVVVLIFDVLDEIGDIDGEDAVLGPAEEYPELAVVFGTPFVLLLGAGRF